MSNTDELIKKWQPVLEHPDLEKIADAHKRSTVAQLLENQERSAREQGYGSGGYSAPTLLGEAAPTNAMGASSSTASAGSVDTFDPVLISLVRRSMPNLIAYDIAGVQPMTGPTGLIFAMRSRYDGQTGTEALLTKLMHLSLVLMVVTLHLQSLLTQLLVLLRLVLTQLIVLPLPLVVATMFTLV